MEGRHGGEHFVGAVRPAAGRKVRAHAECELRFGDAHVVAGERNASAVVAHTFPEKPARHRAIDGDVRLSGLAGRRDLPPEEGKRGAPLEERLDGVAGLACPGAHRLGQLRHPPALLPVLPQQIRRGSELRVRGRHATSRSQAASAA